MRRHTRVSITALVGVTALALASCSAGTGKAATGSGDTAKAPAAAKVMKIAFNQPGTHPQAVALTAMGERINKGTNGRIGVKVFPNETLGAQKETIELVQAGTIGMAMVAGPLLENFNPDFVVFDLPYVFDSQEQQAKVINDPAVVSELYSSLDSKNIHVLGGFHSGVRNVYNSKKAINKPADLAGMKIRVIESDTNIAMMKLMGGTGTPMGQGEVYTAIQSGVLDGAENNELIYSSLKHAEISKYYSYTRHLMFPDYLIINPAVLKAMSTADQKVLTDEVATTIEEANTGFLKEISVATASAKKAGAKFNEVDAKAFKDAVAPLTQSKLTNKVTRGIFAKVQAAAK